MALNVLFSVLSGIMGAGLILLFKFVIDEEFQKEIKLNIPMTIAVAVCAVASTFFSNWFHGYGGLTMAVNAVMALTFYTDMKMGKVYTRIVVPVLVASIIVYFVSGHRSIIPIGIALFALVLGFVKVYGLGDGITFATMVMVVSTYCGDLLYASMFILLGGSLGFLLYSLISYLILCKDEKKSFKGFLKYRRPYTPSMILFFAIAIAVF